MLHEFELRGAASPVRAAAPDVEVDPITADGGVLLVAGASTDGLRRVALIV
ncbi:hypothetical protein [Dactylosporangium sp. NPDC005555]|uniref:hypothetical protein n=1 Tax=Dactylosporangium sp. NPDC005555 TaxID=3154889 RepID=UPI0033ADCC2F